ncbi:HAD-IA family hydrolase [Uliginosibacterium sp. H3]|uniref:HAD-IA family hydrolase n=1 Tax=Uliginosibacterium silvisoli TaxID=3114758 RepID=A0ABU6K049_9RHOO|nr:HAD-IA family hydrolase [Uliginosibacterium sp. H3]
MSDLCVIFDLDGTLVDSEGLCNQAYLDLLPQLAGHGITLDELVLRFRGRKMALIVSELEQILGTTLHSDFVPEYRQHVAHLFSTCLQPMPGVPEMLAQLRSPFCIASSGPLAKIRDALTVTGLLHFFEGRIFSAYEVGSWKPDPGLFLHAAQAMGTEPGRCVVVEDSPVGVEAAQAAGMFALQYLPGTEEAHPYATLFNDMSLLPTLLHQRVMHLHEGAGLES